MRQATGEQRRTVVLASSDGTGKGGQSLRLRALDQALNRGGTNTLRAFECNRWWGRCRSTCRTSGRHTVTDPSVSRIKGRLIWYWDIAYCADHAAALAAEFRNTGVTTVICSGLEAYGYVREFAAHGIPVVFDMHNVELPLHRAIHESAPPDSTFSQRFSREHLRLLEPAERLALVHADEVWACSEVDRRLAVSVYPEIPLEKIRVVPNVVDVSVPPRHLGGSARLCFTGRLDYYPNVQAAETLVNDVAPLLTAKGYDIPVVIAGAKLTDALPEMPDRPNVELVSDPDTVSDLIRDSIVAVPLKIGGGSRFKILEAFALGAPVVASSKGVEGLDVTPGVHYLEADDPDAIARAIGALVDDGDLRVRLAEAAWQLVQRRYSLDALTSTLDLRNL